MFMSDFQLSREHFKSVITGRGPVFTGSDDNLFTETLMESRIKSLTSDPTYFNIIREYFEQLPDKTHTHVDVR